MRLIKYILILLLIPALASGGWYYAGTHEVKYYGFPNTAGTPSAPVGSWTSWGTPVDSTYCNKYDPIVSGTITGINAYVRNDSWTTNAWLVVYRETALIGYSDALGTPGVGWTGYLSLNVVGGQNLNYTSGDNDLYYGLAWDASDGDPKLGYDDGGSSVDIFYDTAPVHSGAPDPTATSWATSAADDMGVILRVTE